MSVCVRLLVRFLALSLGFFALSSGAMANDLAPTPRNAPRTPVDRQVLAGHTLVPPSRVLEGDAVVIDSERIRLQGVEVRLFGVVPPQLSASFGPQARALLDKLTVQTSLHCTIHDRSNDGRLLATCANDANADLALELLKHGLAVTARGSLSQSGLVTAYMAAEQSAQAQKLGLWSGLPPVQPKVEPKVELKAELSAPPVKPEPPRVEASSQSTKNLPDAAEAKIDPVSSLALAPAEKDMPAKAIAATRAAFIDSNAEVMSEADLTPSLLERYQLLATGILMLLTALSIIAAVVLQRRFDWREENRAIAAALRGELMAARAICLARFQQIVGANESGLSWPRLRIVVFQAHVGRIGRLGAELARQVSAIYGLASDYAAYFQSDATDTDRTESATKKQALQKLIGHIDVVLPRLAAVESREPWMGQVRLFMRRKKNEAALAADIAKSLAAPAQAKEQKADPALSLPPAETADEGDEVYDQVMREAAEEARAEESVEEPVEEPVEVKDEVAAIKAAPVMKEKAEETVTEAKVEQPAIEAKAGVAPVEEKTAPENKPAPEAKIETLKAVEEKTAPVAETTVVEAKVSEEMKPEAVAPAVKEEHPVEAIAPAMAEVTFAERIEEPEAEKKSEETTALKPEAGATVAAKTAPRKKTSKSKRRKTALEVEEALAAPLTATWSSLKKLKNAIQQNIVPHPEPPSPEDEEYLAMLSAEAEAFAYYETEETEAPTPRKRA
jgi:endonuclease YncB( thermonuclease family)